VKASLFDMLAKTLPLSNFDRKKLGQAPSIEGFVECRDPSYKPAGVSREKS
jgi:hypothetical protein